MKFNIEIEVDQDKILGEIQSNNTWDINDAIKREIYNQIISTVLKNIDVQSFSNEIQTDFARKVLDKVGELSKEKVLSYLSDEAITKKVNDVVKWRTDEFLQKNITEMFNKMRDEFVFLRKEDYDAEIESLQGDN